jgi:YD repeat-containing protein
MQDPLGNHTRLSYSPLNDLTQIMDEDGNLRQFSYDADRDLVSVKNANKNTTTYTYDAMDRHASRTDPLGAIETYAYDGNSNLTQHRPARQGDRLSVRRAQPLHFCWFRLQRQRLSEHHRLHLEWGRPADRGKRLDRGDNRADRSLS